MSGDLPDWPILQYIPEELLPKVTDVLIQRNNVPDSLVILVQESKDAVDVYSIKLEDKSRSKLGTINGSVVAAAVSEVGTFYVLTTNSQLYSWGNNAYGQVGNNQRGNTVDVPFLVLGSDKLKQSEIIFKIATGSNHVLCLTSEGRLFAWGYNGYGQVGLKIRTANDNEAQTIPVVVEHDTIRGRKIISIACTTLTSFALDSSGCLFGWGDGSHYELATVATGGQSDVPVFIANTSVFQDIAIKEIACGYQYVLALTKTGAVFAWGNNDYYQLGLDRTGNFATPVEIPFFKSAGVQIAKIWASSSQNISLAWSTNGQIYVWGRTRMMPLKTPIPLKTTSLHRAYIDWLPEIGPCHINLKRLSEPTELGAPTASKIRRLNQVPSWLCSSFDKPDHADVKFLIDGRTINAHKSILASRSVYFAKMFSKDATWQEAKSGEVKISGYSYDVYRTLLFFLYTNEIDGTEQMSKESLVSLHDLAKSYFEDELADKICGLLLRKYLNLEGVVSLYSLAVEHEMTAVAAACMELILRNLPELSKSPAYDDLDPVLTKEILKKYFARQALNA